MAIKSFRCKSPTQDKIAQLESGAQRSTRSISEKEEELRLFRATNADMKKQMLDTKAALAAADIRLETLTGDLERINNNFEQKSKATESMRAVAANAAATEIEADKSARIADEVQSMRHEMQEKENETALLGKWEEKHAALELQNEARRRQQEEMLQMAEESIAMR